MSTAYVVVIEASCTERYLHSFDIEIDAENYQGECDALGIVASDIVAVDAHRLDDEINTLSMRLLVELPPIDSIPEWMETALACTVH